MFHTAIDEETLQWKSKQSADWGPKIYKIVEDVGFIGLCRVTCLVDGEPCFLFVYIAPICYLGDPDMNYNLVTLNSMETVYERICKLAKSFREKFVNNFYFKFSR